MLPEEQPFEQRKTEHYAGEQPDQQCRKENAHSRERERAAQHRTHTFPAGIKSTRKKDDNQSDNANRLRQVRVIERIPPGPSEPASIPTARKSTNAGTPTRPEALLATMLRSRRTAVPKGFAQPESCAVALSLSG